MRCVASVAVLIIEAGRSYILQLRDQKPDIHYPGLVGLFGGLVEADENPKEALIREIREELDIELKAPTLSSIITLDTVLSDTIFELKRRYFFLADIEASEGHKLVVREGQSLIRLEDLSSSRAMDFVPYDLAFIQSIESSRRLGKNEDPRLPASIGSYS